MSQLPSISSDGLWRSRAAPAAGGGPGPEAEPARGGRGRRPRGGGARPDGAATVAAKSASTSRLSRRQAPPWLKSRRHRTRPACWCRGIAWLEQAGQHRATSHGSRSASPSVRRPHPSGRRSQQMRRQWRPDARAAVSARHPASPSPKPCAGAARPMHARAARHHVASARPQRWRDEDDRIATHEEHLHLPLGGLDDLLVCLLVDVVRCDCLLNITHDHVQMLVERLCGAGIAERTESGQMVRSAKAGVASAHMQFATELAVVPKLDVYPLVQTEANQVERLLHHRRRAAGLCSPLRRGHGRHPGCWSLRRTRDRARGLAPPPCLVIAARPPLPIARHRSQSQRELKRRSAKDGVPIIGSQAGGGTPVSMARAVPGAASPPIPPFCEAETQTERVDLFECNICLDSANEPVVTFCGHLYCWPCIYRWLQVSTAPLCPVCKTTVTQKKLVPVYGRGKPHMDPRVSTVVPPAHTSPGIPSRPHGRRPESHRRSSSGGAAGLQPGDVLLPPPALAGGQSFGLLGCVSCESASRASLHCVLCALPPVQLIAARPRPSLPVPRVAPAPCCCWCIAVPAGQRTPPRPLAWDSRRRSRVFSP